MKKNLLIITIVQVFLIISLTPANSYFIGGFFSGLGVVSAESLECCLETIEGATCQDVLDTDEVTCVDDAIPTDCDSTSECKLGCCVDEEEGLCSTSTPKIECENNGGEWDDEESCAIEECQKGCCVLGDEVMFVTETRCGKLSDFYGFGEDFRDLNTELECLILKASQEKGACVFESGICKFNTETECLNIGGDFAVGKLCSNSDLETICEKQTSIGCVEGEDEIYWFDSCGNQENIYSSDKDESWNDGEVLEKEESCKAGKSNAESSNCGNCDASLGSRCAETTSGVKDGNYICENLNCVDEEGVERKNGESWCVYDSYIGDGKDTVGSRHWKQSCVDGEIIVDACADYRGEICVQSEIEDSGETFSFASCAVNEALTCLSYNSDKSLKGCTENTDCMIKNVNVAGNFYFDVCVGRYPRGFDLTGKENDYASEICSLASQTCKVVYVRNFWGEWDCVQNCACRTSSFSEQMNDFCVSLGDCGSYVNYIGDGTNNAKVSRAPSVSWNEYTSFAKVVKGQYIEPKDIRQVLGKILGTDIEIDNSTEETSFTSGMNLIGTIAGASGSLITGLTWLTGKSLFYTSATEFSQSSVFWSSVPSNAVSSGATNILNGIGTAAMGFGIGMAVGSLLASWKGLSGDGATAVTFAGGVAGAIAGYAMGTEAGIGSYLTTFSAGMVVFWVAIAIMVLAVFMGWGETRTVEVSFTCMPWQAPLGGDNCNECNDDPLKPCSEYRCSSLGQACVLINENSENPVCEAIENDGAAPVISPEWINESYKFTDEETKKVKIAGKNDECVEEFTSVEFVLETDEYAQCKWELEQVDDYDSMTNYPLEQTDFSLNHSFVIFMPSLDALEVYNVSGDLKEMFGNMNMYVRCEDYYGNYNVAEYIVNFCINSGPDLTAARIVKTEPEEGSFVKYNATEQALKIYLNEPAECSYSDEEDVNYFEMENIMECETDLFSASTYGWECSSNLTGLESGKNDFYIKCRDKPWVNENNVDEYEPRNINDEDYVYSLEVSENELKIDSVSPSGEIESGFEPVSIDLEVETSGGADDGVANCYYSFGENGKKILFYETFSDEHNQNFNTIMRGNYEIFVYCGDEAGNFAESSTNFSVIVDSDSPIVVRAYKDGSKLKIVTNEKAECYYDFNSCNFGIDDGVSMTTVYSTEHSASWISGNTYYIKCADIWGNTNPECAIEINADS